MWDSFAWAACVRTTNSMRWWQRKELLLVCVECWLWKDLREWEWNPSKYAVVELLSEALGGSDVCLCMVKGLAYASPRFWESHLSGGLRHANDNARWQQRVSRGKSDSWSGKRGGLSWQPRITSLHVASTTRLLDKAPADRYAVTTRLKYSMAFLVE